MPCHPVLSSGPYIHVRLCARFPSPSTFLAWSETLCFFKNSSFRLRYPSCFRALSQTFLKILLDSSFSFLPSPPCLHSSISPLDPYFRPPLWFAYRFALVMPISKNFLAISMPTKSSASSYSRKAVHRALDDSRARAEVRKRHKGRRADL